jgi:hypothetical protein
MDIEECKRIAQWRPGVGDQLRVGTLFDQSLARALECSDT